MPYREGRGKSPLPKAINVVMEVNGTGFHCGHQHLTILTAQHCRRLQTRRHPDGLEGVTYRLVTVTPRRKRRK